MPPTKAWTPGTSPSATIIEIKLIEWLREQVGYGAGDAGVFTSGGTQSNLMGLMLARDAFFARQGHSIQQNGLTGDLSKIKVFCSESAHFSVEEHGADGAGLPLRHPGEDRCLLTYGSGRPERQAGPGESQRRAGDGDCCHGQERPMRAQLIR